MSNLRTFRVGVLLVALLICSITVLTRPVSAQQDERARLDESLQTLSGLVKAPDDAIPEYVLERAEAIVIIPKLVKGGFVIGAEHGKGAMAVRDRATNTWSAPSFMRLTGGSIGWQIGLQSVDLVLLVMNRAGIDKLLETEFKLGANASVAAGPIGRSAQASTDAKLTAEILAYSRAKGLFAGATIEGASLKDDADANRKFYGTALTAKNLFADGLPSGRADSVAAWRAELARIIAGASTTR